MTKASIERKEIHKNNLLRFSLVYWREHHILTEKQMKKGLTVY
jgi:hypothetical protein